MAVRLSVSICDPSYCGVPHAIGTSWPLLVAFRPIELVELAAEPVEPVDERNLTACSVRQISVQEKKQK